MQIVIKPISAIAILVALASLAIMAMPKQPQAATKPVDPVAAAVPVVPGQTIYADGFENSWELYGWAKKIQPNVSEKRHDGMTAIRADLQPFEGVKFHHIPFTAQGLDRVTFFLFCGGSGEQKIQVAAENDGKQLKAVNVDTLPTQRWVSVTIPLSQLGVTGKNKFDSIWIKEAIGKPIAPLYLDDIRLLSASDPLPEGPAVGSQPETK